MASVVASLTVLIDIETFLFDNLIATETVSIFNGKEDNHTYYEGEDSDSDSTESLNANTAFYT